MTFNLFFCMFNNVRNFLRIFGVGWLHYEIGSSEGCTSYQACNLSNFGARGAIYTSRIKSSSSYSSNSLILFVIILNFLTDIISSGI